MMKGADCLCPSFSESTNLFCDLLAIACCAAVELTDNGFNA